MGFFLSLESITAYAERLSLLTSLPFYDRQVSGKAHPGQQPFLADGLRMVRPRDSPGKGRGVKKGY
ncbi:MAG: hypothetical protein ACP5F3_08085, partial [Candidatus Syntrophosphaera sp.]